MFYFPKSLLGWCPVYKAASSNVFAHFCSDYFDNETCQDKRVKEKGFKGGFRELKDFKEKNPPPKEEKRFLVVRDPFRRLLSLYRNKVELLSHPAYREIYVDFMFHYRPIRWHTNIERKISAFQAVHFAEAMTEGTAQRKPQEDNPYLYPPYPTFKEIVDATIAGWANVHLIPASQRCGPCGSTKYEFLLKAETFDCDLKNMFNLTSNLRLLTNIERWATNQTPVLDMKIFYSYFSTLSTEQLDGLLYLYQDDCLLFQYPCSKHVENIKQFKLLNSGYKHEYKNTWSGRIGDWDIIS
ncbi:carbohydrate sulfotransferase 11-like isoform X3 [Bolinopsis microptera]